MLRIHLNKNNFSVFLEYAISKCDKISFYLPNAGLETETEEIKLTKTYAQYLIKCKKIIDMVKPDVIERRIAKSYGTSDFGYTTIICIALLTKAVIAVLRASGDFSKWKLPYYPEDICLYKKDTSESWFLTIAHENINYIFDETQEDIDFLEQNKISYNKVCSYGSTPNYEEWGYKIEDVDERKEELFWQDVISESSKKMSLVEACEKGCYDDVVELLQLGKDVNEKSQDGLIPLEAAIRGWSDDICRKEYSDIIKILIKQGANVDYKTSYHQSLRELVSEVLSYDEYEKYSEVKEERIYNIYEILYEEGKLDRRGIFKELYAATIANNHKIMEHILKRHAEVINYRFKSGTTILLEYLEFNMEYDVRSNAYFTEFKAGYIKTIDILVKYGIDLSCKNQEGCTAYDLAKACKKLDIVRIVKA